MSWIVRDLWSTLEARRSQYEDSLDKDRFNAFETVNKIASEVGQRWNVTLQLNFPPGRKGPTARGLGHRDLSLIVHRDWRKFEMVSEADVKNAFRCLHPIGFDTMSEGHDGLRIRLADGHIDCLPGAIHLWCDLTPDLLKVLDWLFENLFGLKPHQGLTRESVSIWSLKRVRAPGFSTN